MQSEKKSGFILDRGFHVLQTGYPLASKVLDYETMSCQAFEPGALIIRPNIKKPKSCNSLTYLDARLEGF